MPTYGMLDKRVKLYRPGQAKDKFGQYLPAPELVAEVWAALRPMGSTESLAAAQLQSGQTHVLIVRHQYALAKADGSWWAEWDGRVFGVVGLPMNQREANEWLQFQVKEGLGHGL